MGRLRSHARVGSVFSSFFFLGDPRKGFWRNLFIMLDYVRASTYHARLGAVKNAFTYSVDFVVTDFGPAKPSLISRNRFNLWSIWDHRHGGKRDKGQGKQWFYDLLQEKGFPVESAQLVLVTQPSYLWFHFNPVSFWVAMIDGKPCAFVAEVNSTFGQRHCYFCAHDDFRPITERDRMVADKLMHVSPFQRVEGQYIFIFGFDEERINIRIHYENSNNGVLATLEGNRSPATSSKLAWAAIRRPLGAARVVALIHWQAVILYFKKAPFLKRQSPPETLLSEGHAKE